MMKTKFGVKLMAGASIVSAFFMGAAPMTAFAKVDEEVTCICEEKCTEEKVNEECKICSYDYTYCEGKEVEHFGPLTPDGNLTLVDDYGSIEAGGKQFITVVTKAGNYFYIIIDRDDNGSETVHFLNMVDESDLLSLMDDDEAKAYIESIEAKEAETEEPQSTEIVTIEDEPVPGATPDHEEVVKPEKEKKNVTGIMAVILVAAIGGIGGYFYLTNKKKATKKTVGPDPDIDYLDDDDEDDILSDIPEDSDFSEDEISDDFDSEE